jgi:hypothetical protein
LDNGVHLSSDVTVAGEIVFPILPILPPGTRLEPGGVYLDLARPARGPFRALLGQLAGHGDRYVAQRDVGSARWRRLVEAAAHAARGETAMMIAFPPSGESPRLTGGIVTVAAVIGAAGP